MDEHDLKAWLATQTDPILSASPPDKFAPASLDPYSVVVLHHNRHDSRRLTRAFQRVLQGSVAPDQLLTRQVPFILKSGLSHPDALLAQFELISCDIISMFIPDSVAMTGDPQYLARLCNRVGCSSEFARVKASVIILPSDDSGKRFIEQFIGDSQVDLPFSFFAARKKVRIMQQWASSIGGIVDAER